MDKVKKTGDLILLEELGNVKKWSDLYMGVIEKIEGAAVLLVEDKAGYQIDIELFQVIPPQEKFLSFYDKASVEKDIMNKEEELTNIVFNAFLQMANEMFLTMWGFMGSIINEDGTPVSIIIMFLEEYKICKYSIVTQSDIEKVKKERWWHKN